MAFTRSDDDVARQQAARLQQKEPGAREVNCCLLMELQTQREAT
jgi:hypothetical protein